MCIGNEEKFYEMLKKNYEGKLEEFLKPEYFAKLYIKKLNKSISKIIKNVDEGIQEQV